MILLAFPGAAPPTSNAVAPATQLTGISALIEKLADPDPRVRQSAEARIVAAGISARPAVLAAWRGGDPRIAPRAARLLLQLPWDLPSDPPAVRQLLAGYGASKDEDRQQIAVKISQQLGCGPALLRMMREDPSDIVSWIVYALIAR